MAKPTVATQAQMIACERCGTFVAYAERVFRRPLCADCAARVREERRRIKLYPAGYLWALGILGNGAIAAVLGAINWSRVNEPKRARSAWILAAFCLAVSAMGVAAGRPYSRVVGLLASLMATQPVLEGWRSLYAEHRRLGGGRASLLLPVAIIAGPMLAAAALYSILVFSRELD
jgi:hypothetical protein